MTLKAIKKFINESYSKGPKKSNSTNKTDVYYIDDICSLDILELKGYGPENNRGYRYVIVVIDNFSKYGWTVPLKNKKLKDSFENFIITSKKNHFCLKETAANNFITIFVSKFPK